MADNKTFFDTVKRALFAGKFTQGQVDGINAILAGFALYGDGNINNLAYALATAKWESAHTMQPIKETQRASDKMPPTDATVIARLDAAFKKGQLTWVKKPYWRTGWFGRGLVQLTHEFNYSGKIAAAVKKAFGVDIHANRDLVMRMDIAVFILIRGIIEGWFTTKALGKYIDTLDESDAEDLREFIAARATVNGKDRATEIGKLAILFEKALRAAQPVAQPAAAVPAPSVPAKAETPASEAPIAQPKEAKVEDFEHGLAPAKEVAVSTATQDVTNLLLPDILKALVKDSTPGKNSDAQEVATAVLKEVAPVLVNKTNNEPIWQSRVVWGLGIGALATVAGLFGITIDPASQGQIVDLTQKIVAAVLDLIALAGLAFALYGRLIARKPMGAEK